MTQDPLQQVDRPFVGSIALVRRFVADDEQWLAVWDERAGAFRLPIARRGDVESYRECLHATLEEALNLNRSRDYVISGLSRAHFQAPIEWPDEPLPQWVIVQFFAIDLYGRESEAIVEQLPGARWLTMSEVARGVTSTGHPICPRQRILIDRTDLLPAEYRST
jgi:hypothetical protein